MLNTKVLGPYPLETSTKCARVCVRACVCECVRTDLRTRKQEDTSLFSSIALWRRVCWQPEGPVLQDVASQPWRT